MELSTRTVLGAGLTLTVASAIAITPLPAAAEPVTRAVTSEVRLAATTDIDAGIARWQAFFDHAAAVAGQLAGVPGRGLIGVAGGIETAFDVGLSRLIDNAADPDAQASFTILRTLAVNAWAMLEHNLGRINPVISATTEQVGVLVTAALTGTAHNLLTPGRGSGRLLVGNGLRAIHAVGNSGFDVAQVVVDELTYQVDNLVDGFSALLTHRADASDRRVVRATARVVRDLVLAPVDTGSRAVTTVLTRNADRFDRLLTTATDTVETPRRPTRMRTIEKTEKADVSPKADRPARHLRLRDVQKPRLKSKLSRAASRSPR